MTHPEPNLSRRSLWPAAARLGVSAVILAALYTQVAGVPSLAEAAFSLDTATAGVVVLLLIPSVLLRSVRWLYLYGREQGVSLGWAIKLLLVGQALNLVLPASAGDVAKSYLGRQWGGDGERMLAISALDKAVALASVALLGLPFAAGSAHGVFFYAAAIAALPLLLLVSAGPALRASGTLRGALARLDRTLGSRIQLKSVVAQIPTRPRTLFAAVLLSVFGWAVTYLQMGLSLHAAGAAVSMASVATAAPALTLVRLAPFTPSGLGTDEAAIVYLFSSHAVSSGSLLIGAFLFRALVIILPGLVGLCFLRFSGGRHSEPAVSRLHGN